MASLDEQMKTPYYSMVVIETEKDPIDEFLETIYEEYCLIYANVSLLTQNEKTVANPETATLHNKSIAIMKDPDGDEPIRDDREKDITGGGNMSSNLIIQSSIVIVSLRCVRREILPNF